jgi:hypothetical protein
MYFIK